VSKKGWGRRFKVGGQGAAMGAVPVAVVLRA
jgi:hypothetical protein